MEHPTLSIVGIVKINKKLKRRKKKENNQIQLIKKLTTNTLPFKTENVIK